MDTASKSHQTEAVDWLELFPSEPSEPPPKPRVERPPVEDAFAAFPLEGRLLDLLPPPERPTSQVRPVPQPAIRIVLEPIDPGWPGWPGWQLPAIPLSARAWTLILTGVGMVLLIVFLRTRLPSMPEVAHTFAVEPARPIDVPSFALAAPKGAVSAPPAARVPTLSVKPASTPPRSAAAIAPRTRPATATITPTAATTFGTDANAGSLLTEPARVLEMATAPAVPAALTPPPAAPPARVTESVTVRVNDTDAIESVLSRYRSAFTALDMRAVQSVWPQVDRRALERTFSEVDEQALQFDDCRIHITGRDARAACSGIARSLPKGSTRTKLESRRWDFTLSKIGTDWLILSAQTRR